MQSFTGADQGQASTVKAVEKQGKPLLAVIAENIEALRKRKKMRQLDLSVVSGVASRTIANIEKGTSTSANVGTLEALAKCLEVPLSALVSEGLVEKLPRPTPEE